MTSVRVNRLVAAVLAGSMVVSSTAAVAAGTAAAPPQVSPWAALTGLTAGAPAATLCGAAAGAAAATQAPAGGCVLPALDTPPPLAEAGPPAPAAVPALGVPSAYAVSPLFLALGALAAGALVFFLVKNKHHTVSPA